MQTTYGRHSSEIRVEPKLPTEPFGPGSSSGQNSGPQLRPRPATFKPRANGNANGDRGLIEALVNSKVFQDYERAFTEATGLPVALRPVESWQLPHHGKRNEGPFCALMSEKSRACASCLQTQEKLSQAAAYEPCTITCPSGLSDTAVPVRLGDRLVGFLQTGQIFRKKPTETQFDRTAKLIEEWGVQIDKMRMKEAYFATRVVPPKQHESVVKLLSIFAQIGRASCRERV